MTSFIHDFFWLASFTYFSMSTSACFEAITLLSLRLRQWHGAFGFSLIVIWLYTSYWQMMIHGAYVRSMSDPVPLYGPRRTLNHDRVDPMPVAPQLSTVESIRMCITPGTILHPCLLAFAPVFEKLGVFSMLSLWYIVFPFVSLYNGMYCYIAIFIHGSSVCFPCMAFHPMIVSRQILLSAERWLPDLLAGHPDITLCYHSVQWPT